MLQIQKTIYESCLSRILRLVFSSSFPPAVGDGGGGLTLTPRVPVRIEKMDSPAYLFRGKKVAKPFRAEFIVFSCL